MSTRFVILRHTGVSDPHFDVMFETAPAALLATWRSPAWPISQPTVLDRLADHRRAYLTFGGDISGNRGHVQRVAAGDCDLEMAADRWVVRWAEHPMLILTRQPSGHWLASPVKEAGGSQP